MEKMLIGWAQIDITPDKPVNLWGHFAERITDKVRDPITATALYIGSEKDYAVLISCDLCAIREDVVTMCRKEIKKKVPSIDVQKVVLNATHTHDAPGVVSWIYPPVPKGVMPPEEYAVFFAGKIAEVVSQAWNNRKEGSIAWAYSQAVVGHNRRAVYFKKSRFSKISAGVAAEGTARMYGETNSPLFSHIEGFEDHGVDMLFTFDVKRQMTGVMVNIACTSQETEGLREISADFWHETRNNLRQKYGKNLYVLPQCSAAGDQSPHLMFYKKANERMLSLKGITMREEIARRITSAVTDGLPCAMKDIHDRIEFKHLSKKLKLKRRTITEAELKLLKREYDELMKRKPETHDEEYARFIYIRRCREAMQRYKLQKTKPMYPAEVHVIRIGDIVLVTNEFELYLDYGIRIKARSPFIQTFVVQLAGGGSYLPTKRGIQGAGYSASAYDNVVGPEGGQQLVEGILEMINQVAR